MDIPKVEFIYAFPFDRDRRNLFAQKGLGEYPSIAFVKEKIAAWKEVWDKVNHDDRVIVMLRDLTGGLPSRSLECFVFGAGFRSMSTPFLLSIAGKGDSPRSDEEFIETMIHELLHIFLSSHVRYWETVQETYAHETVVTRNHILLYAMLCKVYRDLFNTEPADFAKNDLSPDYQRAIAIVREVGHEALIHEFQHVS